MTADKHKAKLKKLTRLCDDDDIDMAKARVIKARMPEPNYFVAIRLSDPRIHSRVQTVQDTVVSHDKRLEAALVPLETLHLTLYVIHLKNEQIEKAKTILRQCRTEILKKVLPSGAFTLKFKGLDYFRDGWQPQSVLFVKPVEEDVIKKLNAVVRDTFTRQGIPSTDTRKFHPHVTVINLSKAPNLKKEGISKIPEESFSTCRDLDFGQEQLSSLHLCSMGPEMAPDGFYNCVAKIDF